MRMEMKVYLSHTDHFRMQEAAKKQGLSCSAFMRHAALAMADSLQVPVYHEPPKGQEELDLWRPLEPGDLLIGGR